MTEVLPEINAAQAESDLRAAYSAPAPETPAPATKVDTTQTQPPAPAPTEVETPNELPSGTPAEAEPKSPTEDKTETEPKKSNVNKPSEFSKNAQRLEKKWTAVVAKDLELKKSEQQLKQRETAIAQREQQVQIKLAKASQKYTPEQYETSAAQKDKSAETLLLQADGLERRAETLENENKLRDAELARQQAQDLRDQANGEKYSAKQLRGMAKNLRENPDPTLQQIQAKNQQAIQAYTIEAAKKWPELSKEGSEFQKTMVGHLQAAKQQGLDETEFPIIRYHITRLTAAETEAARVPDLVKKLGVTEARVKELEALTAPGGGNSVPQGQPPATKDFAKMSLEEQESELRRLQR